MFPKGSKLAMMCALPLGMSGTVVAILGNSHAAVYRASTLRCAEGFTDGDTITFAKQDSSDHSGY